METISREEFNKKHKLTKEELAIAGIDKIEGTCATVNCNDIATKGNRCRDCYDEIGGNFGCRF